MGFLFLCNIASILLAITPTMCLGGTYCYYYPLYPNTTWKYKTFCSYYCCDGYAADAKGACCSYQSLWWISIIVVGVVVLFIAAVVAVLCTWRRKKILLRHRLILAEQSHISTITPVDQPYPTFAPFTLPDPPQYAETLTLPKEITHSHDELPKYEALLLASISTSNNNQTTDTTITDQIATTSNADSSATTTTEKN